MAVDKLVDSTQLDSDLTSVANAIRTKGGTSASLAFPSGFMEAIGAISTGTMYEETVTLQNSHTRANTIVEELMAAVSSFTVAFAYKDIDYSDTASWGYRDCIMLLGFNSTFYGCLRWQNDEGYPATTASSTVANASAGDKFVIVYK